MNPAIKIKPASPPSIQLPSSLVIGYILVALMAITMLTLRVTSFYHQVNVLGTSSELSAAKILSVVNLERQSQNLKPLILNPQLTLAANAKLEDMITQDYFAHTTQSVNPWQFIDASGFQYLHAGENLARDFIDEYDLVQGWLASPPHRENLLNSLYTHTGIAVSEASQRAMVVQMYATPLPLKYQYQPPMAAFLGVIVKLTQPQVMSSMFEFAIYFTLVFLTLLFGYMLYHRPKKPHSLSTHHWYK